MGDYYMTTMILDEYREFREWKRIHDIVYMVYNIVVLLFLEDRHTTMLLDFHYGEKMECLFETVGVYYHLMGCCFSRRDHYKGFLEAAWALVLVVAIQEEKISRTTFLKCKLNLHFHHHNV